MDRHIARANLPIFTMPLLILMSLVGLNFAFLFYSWSTGQDILDQQLEKFDKTRSIAAYSSRLTEDSAQTKKESTVDLFYPSGSDAIISAQVAANFKQLAVNRGLEIIRAGDLPAVQDGPLRLVGESFDLSGSIENVYSIIKDVEEAKPLMFIDKMDFHANGSGENELNSDTMLSVSIQLYAAVQSDSDKTFKVSP